MWLVAVVSVGVLLLMLFICFKVAGLVDDAMESRFKEWERERRHRREHGGLR